MIDVLVATFIGDTAAYFGGRWYGRTPLAPLISPNKTLEGLVAGVLGGTLAFWVAGLYQDWLTGPHALLMGALVALAAPVGDLFESMIKRDLEVKDTGQAVRRPRRRAGPPGRGLLHGPGGLLRGRRARLRLTPTLSPVRRILIVGATGSIGTQALDVVERNPDLEVVGLAASSSWELLLEQAAAHGVSRIALADPDAAARAGEHSGREVLAGAEGLVELITDTDCDLVLNALVGSAGLGPTVAALGEGIDLALANKESLVVGGELVTTLAEATGAQLLPVDSEHSALFQLTRGRARRARSTGSCSPRAEGPSAAAPTSTR